MKTFVSTWKLLISAMGCLPEDIFSEEEQKKVDILYLDLFKKQSAAEIINQECPELIPVLQKLKNWQKENGITISDHQRIKDEIRVLSAEHKLPDEVEIPAVRSLWSFWGLVAELDCIPGRPQKDIVAMFRQDYPGIPESMLATVVCRAYEHLPLAQSAFDIRDWCHETPCPKERLDVIKWNFNFGMIAETIRKKYDLPEYLE